VGEDDRVVVGVDDPRRRVHGLYDLVQIGRGGDARPDVQELADAVLLGEGPHRAVHERPVLAGGHRSLGEGGQSLLRLLTVGRVVGLPAE
jgi:hypothetical protein